MTETKRWHPSLQDKVVERLSRHLKTILAVSGLLLVVLLTSRGDGEIKTDLRYALATASGYLSPLLVAYDTAGEYTAGEVLELSRTEIEQAVRSWPSFHAPIYLQVFNTREKVLFDSRSGKTTPYSELEPVSSTPKYGSWDKERPLLYVDWVPSGEPRWILRAAITAPSYLVAHAWRLGLLIFAVAGAGTLALTVVEVRRRRRFDSLVELLPKLLRQAQAEDTLIREVPEIIARLLAFDSVAVYLLEGDRIVPKAYFSKEGRDPEAFLRSTDQMPIKIQDAYPESQAVNENRAVLVRGPKESAIVHLAKYDAAGSRPYLIVPIRRGGDGAPVGLLTAQRHDGLAEQHADFLQSGAEIVALLLDNVRTREAHERIYRKMIRNTRIETLGTVVPFITHNMKTPLVVVEGLAESIRNDFRDLDAAELETRIAEIKAQTRLSFQLIQSISQYNRLGNTAAPSVNVRQGLERVCGFFRGYFHIKNIELLQQYQADYEPTIKMEELDFVQVITNLLINADDAFSEMRKQADETLSREHQRIEVKVEAEAEKVRITVIDNGPGIKSEDRSRVFDQFTTKEHGTGVGLPYCRRVVEEGGGTIDLESSCGEGTTVSILMPTIQGEVS